MAGIGLGLRSRGMDSDSTPICRCRVLYLGSAVPHVTKDGLQGIQEPLRELYPEQGAIGARGIDSWLSVWSNGLLLENVDENHKKITRFFPIDTLHYCAAVRYVSIPENVSPATNTTQPRFLPLDSPFARSPNPSHPPLFAAILRRTTGIKVLECHTFICKREIAANALVRCCFHAYADSAYARHIDSGSTSNSVYGTLRNYNQPSPSLGMENTESWNRVTGSTLNLERKESRGREMNQSPEEVLSSSTLVDDVSIYNGDENHKIWAGSTRDISSVEKDNTVIYGESSGSNTICSRRSGTTRTRPRQLINAPPPPRLPPVPKDEKKKGIKEKSSSGKKKTSSRKEDLYPLMNGTLLRPGTSSSSPPLQALRCHSSMSGATMMKGATLGRSGHPYSISNGNGSLLRPAYSYSYIPSPSHHHHPPQPLLMVPGIIHPQPIVGTIPHHPPKRGVIVRPHMVPPNFVRMPPHPMYLQGKKSPKHYQMTMEEPIYVPSTRPMSPIASYQPNHFPHEAYLMQQYASNTLDVVGKKKEKRDKRFNSEEVSPFSTQASRKKEKNRDLKKSKGKPGPSPALFVNGEINSDDRAGSPFDSYVYQKKGKDANNDRKTSEDNLSQQEGEEGESPFNTGIYRRKGHLNERAFSYSIRQEHRSRSYGSLANLKFAPPPIISNGHPHEAQPDQHHHSQILHNHYSNGNGPTSATPNQEIKKERELVHMMQHLDLSEDELERSQVPQPSINMYQHRSQQPFQVRR